MRRNDLALPARIEGARRWPGLWSLVIAIVGLGVSVYLTVEHFSATPSFACPESSTVNCLKVTTSRWSHVGPIPVAVLGLAFFTAMTLLCLPVAWRVRLLVPVRVAAAVTGVLVALILVWIELFKVDAICLYCTAVHVCSLLLLGSVLWTTSELRPGAASRDEAASSQPSKRAA